MIEPVPNSRRFACRLIRFTSWLVLTGSLANSGAAFAELPNDRVRVSTRSFASQGSTISVEHFEPAAPGKHPRILVLHGAGGSLLDGPEMRRVSRALAEDGNSVDLIRYFERTGTLVALDSTMQRNYETWLGTVRDAVNWASTDSHRRVGIFGYSLGAFLAVAAASDNPKVGAVVELAGGIWNNERQRIGRMPPVMVIHGRLDRRVPFARYCEPLLARLQAVSPHVEKRVFADEGHGFRPAAIAEVRRQTVAFFREELAR